MIASSHALVNIAEQQNRKGSEVMVTVQPPEKLRRADCLAALEVSARPACFHLWHVATQQVRVS